MGFHDIFFKNGKYADYENLSLLSCKMELIVVLKPENHKIIYYG
jgi:hypothetical protein